MGSCLALSTQGSGQRVLCGVPTQWDRSPPTFISTQASLGYWLLPCLPGGPMSLGPRAQDKRGLSTHWPKCCCARSHRWNAGWGGVGWGGLGGQSGAAAALFNKITDEFVCRHSAPGYCWGGTAVRCPGLAGPRPSPLLQATPTGWTCPHLSDFWGPGAGKQGRPPSPEA